eukprot:GHVN01007932.1.p1 GENE.GHVN01007932.1~~GHVN01007932.1.p1  ORF type:complete len:227 (-),score=36.04 GHVN01007932.1:428-1108(-)
MFLTRPFVNSTFGDRKLFVQHQPFEDDLMYRPDWNRYMNPYYLSRTGAPFAYRGLFKKPYFFDDGGENFLALLEQLRNVLQSPSAFIDQLEIFGILPQQLYEDLILYIFDAIKRMPDDYAPFIRSAFRNPVYALTRLDQLETSIYHLKLLLGDENLKYIPFAAFAQELYKRTEGDEVDTPTLFSDVPFFPTASMNNNELRREIDNALLNSWDVSQRKETLLGRDEM